MRFPLDLIETTRTSDRVIEFLNGGWATYRVRPPGAGWTIVRDRERATIWTRRRAVVRHRAVHMKRRWLR
jgi:hypothetical protein